MRLRFEAKQKQAFFVDTHRKQRFHAMETNGHRTDGDGNLRAENNYTAHQEDPAPSPEAIKEPNDRPASNTMWVAIVIAIILASILYLVFVY